MNAESHFCRAQVYRFLAGAFLYPAENWLEDLPSLAQIMAALEAPFSLPELSALDLEALQADHRYTLGLSGSLPYETEVGLPDEFRQSQELADIAGFYRAFGFRPGGAVRERPDYLATELEFMCLLALKQAYAASEGHAGHVEVCTQAQKSFLQDHLGRWIELMAEGLAQLAAGEGTPALSDRPYLWLARFAASFVKTDAERLGATVQTLSLRSAAPTPPGQELSCETCPAVQ